MKFRAHESFYIRKVGCIKELNVKYEEKYDNPFG